MFDPSRDLFWVYFILVVDAFLFWGIVIAIEKAEAPVQRYMTRMRQRGVETSSEGAGSALSVQHPPKPASVSDVTMNVVSAKSGEFNRSPDPMVNEERKGVESGENKVSVCREREQRKGGGGRGVGGSPPLHNSSKTNRVHVHSQAC